MEEGRFFVTLRTINKSLLTAALIVFGAGFVYWLTADTGLPWWFTIPLSLFTLTVLSIAGVHVWMTWMPKK